MDVSIIEKISCNIIENGSTTVNSQLLYDIIRKIDDSSDIEIISNNNKILTIRSNGSRFSLASLPKEDFPIIDTTNEGSSIKIKCKCIIFINRKNKICYIK